MTTPTASARRTAHRELEKPFSGLDRIMVSLQGRWKRRRQVLKQLLRDAEQIDRDAHHWTDLSEAHLKDKLSHLRAIYRRGGKALPRETELQSLAAIREAATRCLGMRPFTVQLAGALALRRGMLAEMATGEGKTLTAVLAAIPAGWSGRPCHIVTVNDYLATRDANRMRPLYRFCGLNVGHVTGPMKPPERKTGYAADVTYTTSKEVVADFLRDRLQLGPLQDAQRRGLHALLNPALHLDERLVMRGLHTAIIDEADSVLIDEAVTPLIISRSTSNVLLEQACRAAATWAAEFVRGVDYRIDERERRIVFLPAGERRIDSGCAAFPPMWQGHSRRTELLQQALTARELFHHGQQYVVQDEEVVIVDEFTGRMMPGRTWREGLHQAVEAKEGLPVTAPSETLARISFQRYFRLYEQLSGMTGTATEASDELWQMYRLPVIPIPTHRPCVRVEHRDRVFADAAAKWEAATQQVSALHAHARPVLVGTRHIDASERLSGVLEGLEIQHQLLHAVHHRKEAQIVAGAGQSGRVTIATNMAGRGTDILLGRGVAALGGLCVVATERHEARRIDRQLYGRCARQGDPGEVFVFVSMEDELLARHLPKGLRNAIAAALRHAAPGARLAALVAFRYVQFHAQRQAFLQRREVLRTDTWIDESLSFSGLSRYM